MIRFLLIIFFLIIFFIISIPIYLFEWILGKININARHRSCRFIISNAFRFCLFISGVKLKVEGKENIPEEACLFVANHNGFFDIVTTYVAIGKVMGFISKKEAKKVPFLNVWMHLIGCLFLDRKDIKQGLKTILKAADYIKNGISMFVFPEGTRSLDGKMLPFKEGSMKMAEKSTGIVVPLAIKGTAERFERQFPKIRPGVVSIKIGKPIYIKELTKEEKKFLGAYTQKIIQEMLDEAEE